MFWFEKDLEHYLEVNLSLLEQNLLVIGRQVKIGNRRRIDLLAIDSTGIIYIIELKLNKASPGIIAQVLDYRHSVKRLTREEIIRVIASGDLKIHLESAFQRHFGHPLPETVNQSQVLMIIAASIHPTTARSILELKEAGYSITTLRYAIQHDTLSLIPCHLDEQDMNPHTPPAPRKRRARSTSSRPNRLPGYKVRIDVEWFWRTHAHRFVSHIVTFEAVYALYEQWARTQTPDGLDPLPDREFGRQLAALTAASGEWTRVVLPPGTTIDVYEPLAHPPSVRLHRDAGHWMSAYQRNRSGDACDPRAGSSLNRPRPRLSLTSPTARTQGEKPYDKQQPHVRSVR